MMDLEKEQQSPRMFKSSIETRADSQYLCQFTMLLMDTVEELALRVSQIDFVCRQHFPDLQTLSQSIQKKILGFSKSEDLEWKKKELSLLRRINELESESQHSQAQMNQMNASLEETKEKLMIKEQLLNRCEREKKEFLEQLVQKVDEAVKAKENEEDLLKQIELKDKKIEAELSGSKICFQEYNRLKTNYKNLKSQYNFLLSKHGYGMTSTPHSDMIEDEKRTSTDCVNKRCNGEMKDNKTEASAEPNAYKDATVAAATTKQCIFPPKPPPNVKKAPAGCPKRSTPRWRDTRTRQEVRAGDPHDDFLDTPAENVQNLNAADKCADDSCSDEETLDVSSAVAPGKSTASSKKFKYVEPVRRKAERENLRGVECQQCRKFYDAVLPDGGKDAAAMRCEHHDAVSRHRYRHAPPLTPEGFWNIGFDSDL